MDKKRLKLILAKLKVFDKPKVELEQYYTPAEIAAEVIWNAYMLGDIKNKVVLDPGCGTGILGIGAMLLEAKKVVFVEVDIDAIKVLKENLIKIGEEYEIGEFEIMEGAVEAISDLRKIGIETVVQNPPFGTKEKHIDKTFLEVAFRLKSPIYTFHKISTKDFIEIFTKDSGFEITHFWQYKYPLPKTQDFHTKNREIVEVGCWRLVKN